MNQQARQNETYEAYDDYLQKFAEMLKVLSHAVEIQIYTGELLQIYRDPSFLDTQIQQKIHKAIESFNVKDSEVGLE